MDNMKKFLPLIALLLSSVFGFSQTGSLLLNQNFTGVALGNLTTANGAWTNQSTGYVQVANATSMTYPTYTSGANYVSITNGGGLDDPYKTFIGATTITATTTSIYYSFVVRVGGLANTPTNNGTARAVVSLFTNGTNEIANFFLGDDGTHLKFGIDKNANTGATWAAANYTFATVYLVVIRYDYVAGANNDNMYMWVNPSTGSTEPTIASAAVSQLGGTDPIAPNTDAVTALEITQTTNGSTALFDGFKAAYGTGGASQAINSAFAWTQLSPAGAPLPIKIYYFNAGKGTNVNTLNWQAECSSTQATFVIERSSDGRNFTAINSITATQARCAQPFSYDDASTSALAGTSFYRIKMIDIDGRETYTAIVKVGGQAKDMQLAGVLPNPVSNTAQLSITTSKKDKVELSVVSIEGKVVSKNTVQVQSGSTIVNLNVAGLTGGTYFIKGIFSDGQTNTVKFIKQ